MKNGVIFTMDTDYCSEEVLEWSLQQFAELKIPVTVFATGPYECLENPGSSIEVGIHPNFFGRDDHKRVIAELLDIYPEAKLVRSHGLFEYANLLKIYTDMGLTWDSSQLLYMCENISTYRLPLGLWRLPIFWEDDDYIADSPDWSVESVKLACAGVKCLDFHPIHLKLNSVTLEQYHHLKKSSFADDILKESIYQGDDRGVFTIFLKVVEYIKENNLVAFFSKDGPVMQR